MLVLAVKLYRLDYRSVRQDLRGVGAWHDLVKHAQKLLYFGGSVVVHGTNPNNASGIDNS